MGFAVCREAGGSGAADSTSVWRGRGEKECLVIIIDFPKPM